jgi:hypothetical protein
MSCVTTVTGAGARRRIVAFPREVIMTSFRDVKESVTFSGKVCALSGKVCALPGKARVFPGKACALPGKTFVFPGKACPLASHAAADKISTMKIFLMRVLCIVYFNPKTTMLDLSNKIILLLIVW